MSYTEVKIIEANGDVTGFGPEFRNSHGFCPFVWAALCDKYKVADRMRREGLTPSIFFGTEQQLWRYHQDGTIPLEPWEDATLTATYDNVLIKAADVDYLVASFIRFEKELKSEGRVCHLGEMAKLIAGAKRDIPDILGVAFYGTSLIGDPFWVYNDPDDDGAPLNVLNLVEPYWYAEFVHAALPLEGTMS